MNRHRTLHTLFTTTLFQCGIYEWSVPQVDYFGSTLETANLAFMRLMLEAPALAKALTPAFQHAKSMAEYV